MGKPGYEHGEIGFQKTDNQPLLVHCFGLDRHLNLAIIALVDGASTSFRLPPV